MDHALSELAKAAEEGAWCPELRILAGNTFFVGTPVPNAKFLDQTEHGIGEDYYNANKPTKLPTKKAQEAVRAEALDYAQRAMVTVRRVAVNIDGEAMTLGNAQIWPASGGDGLRVRAVRVPLDAIDGWWIGGGQQLRSGGTGGWFLGASVPVD